MLHVPSLGLIVGGDTVYNGVHPYLSETDRLSRREWISTLDGLAALNPLAVVAGHEVPENQVKPGIIAETQKYLRDLTSLLTRLQQLGSRMIRCSRSIPISSTQARCGQRLV